MNGKTLYWMLVAVLESEVYSGTRQDFGAVKGCGIVGDERHCRALYDLFCTIEPKEKWVLWCNDDESSSTAIVRSTLSAAEVTSEEIRLDYFFRKDLHSYEPWGFQWGVKGCFDVEPEFHFSDWIMDLLSKADPAASETKFCSFGTDILARTSDGCEAIADLLEQVEGMDYHTSYYDPEEDKRNDEVDSYTGWYTIYSD